MVQNESKKIDISAAFLLSGQNLPSTVTVNVFKKNHLSD